MTLYRSLSVDLPVEMCSRTAATAVSRSNNNNNNNNNEVGSGAGGIFSVNFHTKWLLCNVHIRFFL